MKVTRCKSRRTCLAFGLNGARGGRRDRERCARRRELLDRTNCGNVLRLIQGYGCVFSNSWKEPCTNKHSAYCCSRPQLVPNRLVVLAGIKMHCDVLWGQHSLTALIYYAFTRRTHTQGDTYKRERSIASPNVTQCLTITRTDGINKP